jgi:hypothetical protein
MKIIFIHVFILILTCFTAKLSAQVGINNINSKASGSAMPNTYSTNNGRLTQRISTESRNLVPSPATGLLIYNTTTNLFNYYSGSYWYQIEATFVSATTGISSTGGGVSYSTTPTILADHSAKLDASVSIRDIFISKTDPGFNIILLIYS